MKQLTLHCAGMERWDKRSLSGFVVNCILKYKQSLPEMDQEDFVQEAELCMLEIAKTKPNADLNYIKASIENRYKQKTKKSKSHHQYIENEDKRSDASSKMMNIKLTVDLFMELEKSIFFYVILGPLTIEQFKKKYGIHNATYYASCSKIKEDLNDV